MEVPSDIVTFCKNLPKIELHAHLNGSISYETLKKLYEMKSGRLEGGDIPGVKPVKDLEDCFSVFRVAHDLTCTPAAVKVVTKYVVREFAADGVIYLELRSTPREVRKVMSREKYVTSIINGIESSGVTNKIKVKLLLSIDRRLSKAVAEETLQLALSAREKYPDVVVGLDLSGDPTNGWVTDLLPVLEQGRAQGLYISAHCAEVPNESEANAILDSCPDRLGHCTCILPSFGGSDDLWSKMSGLAIPAEICLSSNVLCGTVKSYSDHHFGYFYEADYPVALCTDDKGVFRSNLSNEYFLASKYFNLSRYDLWNTSFNSINYAFTNEDQKQKLRDQMLSWKRENGHYFKYDS